MNNEFKYQLLHRLKEDCEYFLGVGRRVKKSLWAGSESAQIEKMKELWGSFSQNQKPEWLTLKQINIYAQRMGVKS
ncbi:MAG: hypothetical protein LBS74_11130 [Oscillospiraceae bacterium]|jgi:hypothetical protein|nr:hypothetical protein [Oscillospiraceae bacterium]